MFHMYVFTGLGLLLSRVTNDNRNMSIEVFNFEANREHEDMELSSISLFKAHGIIYVYNKIIVNKTRKKSIENFLFDVSSMKVPKLLFALFQMKTKQIFRRTFFEHI